MRDSELDGGFGVAAPVATERPQAAGAGRAVRNVGLVAACYVAINMFMLAFAAEPFRWWANFITLPGLVLLALALSLYRAAKETRFVLAWIGAIVLTTGLLLFAHKMGALWPLMIVVPCLGPVVLFG